MSDIVQVIRILIYEGDRSKIEETLKRSSIPLNGDRMIGFERGETGMMVIKSKIIGDFPTIMKVEEEG